MKRIGLALSLLLAVGTSSVADDVVDFGRRIRPLLAEKCFSCHGLDEKHREGGLRLDTQEGLYGTADSGDSAVVPGDPDHSSIYLRMIAEGDERMPPATSDKSLTAEEIELVRQWISQGAKWQQHWSLIAPVRPEVPAAGQESWARNEIDRFILARLKMAGLEPSEQADKAALLRRVTYDLTGLPPSPSEVRLFLADDSPAAYETVIDRLLKSPHYGEHMARIWLDAARYGDTHGLHLDNYRVMWPYRDWVVRAFNNNMPFDQFTVEQLAGDLLPDAGQEQILATGFNRCNVTTSEGGALPEEYEVYYTNDRVATMSTVWMGVSMGCVTCHDSKFDPFEMKDFYQLYAFFNNLDGPVMDGNSKDTAPVVRVMNDAQRTELTSLTERVKELENLMASELPDVDQQQKIWESQYRDLMESPTEWTVMTPEKYSSSRSAAFEKLEDNSLLISGPNASQDVYEIVGKISGAEITAIRLEGLIHPSLTEGGAGRSSNSNVVLTEFEAEIVPENSDSDENRTPIKLTRAWADHEQPDGDFKIGNAIDGKPETGWAINGHQRREDRTAVFLLEKPLVAKEEMQLRVRLRHESVYAQHQFGRIRLSTTSASRIPQFTSDEIPSEIASIIQLDSAERDEKQVVTLRSFYRNSVTANPQLKSAREELMGTVKREQDLEASLPVSLVWRETEKPKPAHILIRGAYNKPGAEVFRNTPSVLPPMIKPADGSPPTRLDLARWLMSGEHPLTARVIVNRFWQQFFGTGIVETSEDFGSQGSPPSHPELLDWLAVDFRESGWDVKRMHKAILMSATYQQSARIPGDTEEAATRRHLFGQGPRFRMDAEMIRDTALAASGLLVPTLGGPSVKPYQPPGIWEAVAYTDSNTANFSPDSGEALYRRSLYTFWKRTAPPPTMVTLDAPSRETCTVRRSRTNTPLAALALMNDVQFVEASRAMAQRVILEGGTDDDSRIVYSFLLTLGRSPSSDETRIVKDVLSDAALRYEADPSAAALLISVGESKADSKIAAGQLAAWTMVANMLLNLDETITK